MFDIGLPELLLIGVVVLLLFGPEKLPEIARSLGKGMQKVKQAQMQFQNELNSVKEEMKVQEDDIVEDPINEMKKNVIKNVDDIKKNLRNLNKNWELDLLKPYFELRQQFETGKESVVDTINELLKEIDNKKDLNAFITLTIELAKKQSFISQKNFDSGKPITL